MMHATVQFDNQSEAFVGKVAIFADTMMALMATAIQSQIITSGKVPFLPVSTKHAQRGALRSSIRSRKSAVGSYVVTAGENSPAGSYAAAQEAGITNGHQIKNYSTPGTGPHFMQDAVDTIKERAGEYAQQAQEAADIGGTV